MKIKVDKYKVFCKKRQREFEILVFEPPRHMWAYDDFPEEDLLAIDGDKDAYKLLKYAYAILAQDSSKIIYFAIADQGIGAYYAHDCNLVLVRPELQFRYSDWYQIKPKLDKKHWAGKYTYNYNKQKLVDYYHHLEKDWHTPGKIKRAQEIAKEEILGDTVFMTVPQIDCYENHNHIVEMLRNYRRNRQRCWRQGWLLSDRNIREMYEEGKKSEKKAQ